MKTHPPLFLFTMSNWFFLSRRRMNIIKLSVGSLFCNEPILWPGSISAWLMCKKSAQPESCCWGLLEAHSPLRKALSRGLFYREHLCRKQADQRVFSAQVWMWRFIVEVEFARVVRFEERAASTRVITSCCWTAFSARLLLVWLCLFAAFAEHGIRDHGDKRVVCISGIIACDFCLRIGTSCFSMTHFFQKKCAQDLLFFYFWFAWTETSEGETTGLKITSY